MQADVADSVTVEQHLMPLVIEQSCDRARDLETARRVGVGAVQNSRTRPRRGDLDERREVRSGGRMVDAGPATREEQRTSVEDALHEHPLAGPSGATPVDLRRSQHRYGQSAVEQYALGRDLVRAVALARVEVDVARPHRRLRLSDRPVEARRDIGVRMVSRRVGVDGLGRDHHRGRRVSRQGQQPPASAAV